MNNYAVYVGVDVSKHSFTTTLLFNELRKTFNVPSKPEQFENRLRPFLEELGVDKSNVLIIMESTSTYVHSRKKVEGIPGIWLRKFQEKS
jgi:hypothetical protein